jgi:hypothetical protein
MQIPPLLPEETLVRVMRLARLDGLSVLALGGVFALLAASSHEVPLAAIGLLAAGAGAIELHGASLLRGGEARGMNWLLASQPFLLLVLWAYCGLRVTQFELPELPEGAAELAAVSAAQWQLSVEEYLRRLNTITVGVVAVVGLAYQGGMTLYYWRRREAVARALDQEA